MRLGSLRRRYPEEYALLEAESLNSYPFSSSRRESIAATKSRGLYPGLAPDPAYVEASWKGARIDHPGLTRHPLLLHHHHPHTL